MNIRAWIERIRENQFLVPAVMMLGSLGLVFLTNRADGRLSTDGLPYLVPATIQSGRTMLGTIAGAIITVAALVFSLTTLTVQMAASQYSPRAIQGFLRDRFQQVVLGTVMATFTYAITGLATLGSDPADGARADWTATAGVVLGVGSALLIVLYIDYVTRRIRIDDTIQRLARTTEKAFESAPSQPATLAQESWHLSGNTESLVVRSDAQGWVQYVDLDDLASALPPASIARVELQPGQYASAGTRLVTVWQANEAAPLPVEKVQNAFAIGGARSIDADDPGFGIRLLVDIAQKALSPGINDPATAADVVRHLAGPVRAAYRQPRAKRSFVDAESGTRLVLPGVISADEFVRLAFSEIRLLAGEQPSVLKALAETLLSLRESLRAEEIEPNAVDTELELLAQTVDKSPIGAEDLAAVRRILDTD